ncbi:hypothetical protein ACTXT7_016793, partial [Hymenolepis weldensis]
ALPECGFELFGAVYTLVNRLKLRLFRDLILFNDGVSSNSTESTTLPQREDMVEGNRIPGTSSNDDGSSGDVENFPGPRTPLLHQSNTSS